MRATEGLTDDEACRYGVTKGLSYVLNGEVNDFYRVAPMTFRKDRANVAMRVLRVDDCSVVASAVEASESATNFATPEGMIERTARKLLEKL